MTKPMSKMLLYVGLFFLIVFGWYGVKKILFLWYVSHYKPPAATVSASTAVSKTWQSYLTAVGTLTAVNGVELSSEAPGVVQEIRFNSGQFVRKGEPIILMRTGVEQANLKSSEAKLTLAKINYEREKTLFNKKVSSQSTLDIRQAELSQAEAAVDAVQAQIQQKTITAPFDGRLGIRQINLGQYLPPGTPMVTLQSLSPLYVTFNLPEQHLSHLYLGQDVEISLNLAKGKTVHGKITAINSKVEQNTRNVQVQATIPNDKFLLYPGMYALVKVWLSAEKNTVAIPQTAVSYSLSGDYVFLIKEESKSKQDSLLRVYRQYVKVGERRDNEVSILEGLKAEDRIITSGQLKLQNGARVLIDENVEL